MGLFDFLKKDKKTGRDPSDLKLSTMKSGDYVDYDLKTWQIKQTGFYEWGANDTTKEWQLKSGNEIIYLELESEDEEEWSVSRRISFSELGEKVKKSISDSGDPPDSILYENTEYYLEISGGGHYYENGKPLSKKLLKWDYTDKSGEKYLSIEQWGENDFDASTGIPAYEYQFCNITPESFDE